MDILVDTVSFRYNHAPVLENLNFEIESAQLIGIVGPNGAGKSTILKLIERILTPKQGNIHIGDEDLKSLKIGEIAKKISYIPQSESPQFPSTVFNTILLGRKPYFSWAPRKEDIEIVSKIIEELELREIAQKNIDQISGGQKQKVLFGRALAQNSDILLLDEPTANLDLRHQLEVLELLQGRAREGKTVIMAIHDINLALKYCDKFIVIHDHEVFAFGTHEIFTPEVFETVFRVKCAIQHNEDGRKYILPESYLN